MELSREYMKFYVGGCQGDRRPINTGVHPVFEGDKGDGMVTEGLSQSWEGCYCLSEGSRLSDSLENSTLNRHLRQR